MMGAGLSPVAWSEQKPGQKYSAGSSSSSSSSLSGSPSSGSGWMERAAPVEQKVLASALCPPRPGTRARPAPRTAASRYCLASVSLRTRRKGKRRGSGGEGPGDGEDDRAAWDAFWDSWDGTGGGSGGSGGGGDGWSFNHHSGNGDFFQRAAYEAMWLWQLVCLLSMAHSVHHLLFPKQASQGASAAADLSPSVTLAVTC